MKYALEIKQGLEEIFEDVEINIWEKGEDGKLFANQKQVLKFNTSLIATQIDDDEKSGLENIIRFFAEYIDKRYYQKKDGAMTRYKWRRLDLTETHVKMAMANTKSNRAAAAYLHVAYNTYKKYAKRYFDKATGKDLFEIHKNQFGVGILKGNAKNKIPLEEIFNNQHLKTNITRLKRRLIQANILEEKCAMCGYNEARWEDGEIPLQVDHIDGNKKNFARDNLRLLCYNHTFHVRGLISKHQLIALEKRVRENKYEKSKEEYDNIFDKFNEDLN